MAKDTSKPRVSLNGPRGQMPSPSGIRRPIRASLLGAVLLLGPLALLGEWLIKSTHHRPLGAATFASCTILLWLGFEFASRVLFAAKELRPNEVVRSKQVLTTLAVASSVLVFARALLNG